MRATAGLTKAPLIISTVLMVGAVTALAGQAQSRGAAPQEAKRWTEVADTAGCKWSSTGRNDFFILEPGDQAVFEGRDGRTAVTLVITVLNDIRRIGNVDTRVVEERETHNGQLEEVSRNFFALCGPSADVFYFGEEVDIYKNGKLADHEGSWVAEKAGAKAGLFMPARPLLGARFYQELAPGVAMDRVEVMSDREILKTPAREFRDAVKTEETTPLEPGVKDYKVYARGVGMIQDGVLLLTQHRSVAAQN